ncbi:hypothetical protein [Vibrio algivorus]|uniref:Uncharacterized protein n=1 Tax=Vibrio algivorus TaxID=1667024 RepID=A0A557P352_9VIBR|nr:hypothetical protein [Vibrio algivorus]TVO35091.1 hypothetical protein FOF44_12370 [Vibrio algivorus]
MARKKFNTNRKANSFLNSIPQVDIENSNIEHKMKFNFSYFCHDQTVAQNFPDWTEGQLHKLLDKLVQYSKEKLDYWEHEQIGRGNSKGRRQTVLEVYGDFPSHSEFIHPRHVPIDACWARFRLENSVRLIGFVIPEIGSNDIYDKNTFYVVFLDKDHKFYPI